MRAAALTRAIELQAVAQVVLGATLQLGVPVNGAMTASRVITGGQAMGGAQVVFNIPGTNRKIQVVMQVRAASARAAGR